MAREQDVIRLPFQIIDYTDPQLMAIAVKRNFTEIERRLSLLQGYIKQITGSGVADLINSADIWDRAENINDDGTISTEKLTDKLVGKLGSLEHDLQLAEGAVTESSIEVGAITSSNLGENTVTNFNIAAGAVTEAKTNWQTHILY